MGKGTPVRGVRVVHGVIRTGDDFDEQPTLEWIRMLEVDFDRTSGQGAKRSGADRRPEHPIDDEPAGDWEPEVTFAGDTLPLMRLPLDLVG